MPSFYAPQIFPSISLIPLAQLLTWGSDLQLVSTPLHHHTTFGLINLILSMEESQEHMEMSVHKCIYTHIHCTRAGRGAKGYSESQAPLNKSLKAFLISPSVALTSFSFLISRSWYLFSKILPQLLHQTFLDSPYHIHIPHKHYDCYCDPLGWQQDSNIFAHGTSLKSHLFGEEKHFPHDFSSVHIEI